MTTVKSRLVTMVWSRKLWAVCCGVCHWLGEGREQHVGLTLSGKQIVQDSEGALVDERSWYGSDGAGQWDPVQVVQVDGQDGTPTRLKLLTFNVWFDSHVSTLRWNHLIRVLEKEDADVVCLQEITINSLHTISNSPFIQANYAISDNLESFSERSQRYDVMMMVRKSRVDLLGPLKRLAVTSQQGRGFLFVQPRLLGSQHTTIIGTIHLESLHHNHNLRRIQFEEIHAYLRAKGVERGFILSDTNHCSTWVQERLTIHPQFTQDAWQVVHPELPGWTEDTEVNAMLKEKEGGKVKQVRYDRILHFDYNNEFMWMPQRISILGTSPVFNWKETDLQGTAPSLGEGQVWISDHFGLSCTYDHTNEGQKGRGDRL